MTALESLREEWTEPVAPESHRLVGRLDPPLGEQIFDVAMAQIETSIEPDRVLNDLRGESVALVSSDRAFHLRMVA
jgi:hypothetical protein